MSKEKMVQTDNVKIINNYNLVESQNQTENINSYDLNLSMWKKLNYYGDTNDYN